MSESIHEQLSALVDDELPAAERALLLRRLATDPALRARWGRHHLVGDALRDGLPVALPVAFADRLAPRLGAAPAPARRPRWLRGAAGAVAAAAVAAVALLTLQVERPAEPAATVVAPPTANPQVPVSPRFATADGWQWDGTRPEVQAELNRYLLNHADQAVPADEPAPAAERDR